MGRKRKLSKCQSEAAENKNRWCKPCQHHRGVNQCEGPVPEARLAEDEGHDDKLRHSLLRLVRNILLRSPPLYMHDLRQGLVPGCVPEVFAIADNRADKDPRTEDFSDDHIRQTYQIARPARLSSESGIPSIFDVACCGRLS